jgi:hypothetical protein
LLLGLCEIMYESTKHRVECLVSTYYVEAIV